MHTKIKAIEKPLMKAEKAAKVLKKADVKQDRKLARAEKMKKKGMC